MRQFLTALLGLVFLCAPVLAEVPPDKIDWFNRYIDETNFRVNHGCSGTLVDVEKKLVLTAFHCVSDKIWKKRERAFSPTGAEYMKETLVLRQVQVENYGLKKFFIANIVKFGDMDFAKNWGKNDLALLQLETGIPLPELGITQAAHIAPADYNLKRGQKVYSVGNPGGRDGTLREGIISYAFRPGTEYRSMGNSGIQYDAGTFYGNSGGSIYSADFLFLGVASTIGISGNGGADPTQGFAVPYWRIHQFLAEMEEPTS